MSTLINGTSYSWSQIKINILGSAPVGVTKISYKTDQEVSYQYGLGNKPISRGLGKEKSEASITLSMKEVQNLREKSPTGQVPGMDLGDVVVSFLPKGGKIVTQTLHNCIAGGDGVDVSSGAMNIEVEIPLNPSHITWK